MGLDMQLFRAWPVAVTDRAISRGVPDAIKYGGSVVCTVIVESKRVSRMSGSDPIQKVPHRMPKALSSETLLKPARILIVDDSRIMLDALKDRLEILFKSRAKHIALESVHMNAVKGLGTKKFDLVITDMMVDGRKEGILVARAVKRLQPNCYVIGMSSDTYSRKDFMKAGADDFFDKGGDFDEIRRVLNRFFNRTR
jgi:CheY-like chemotaxis protein